MRTPSHSPAAFGPFFRARDCFVRIIGYRGSPVSVRNQASTPVLKAAVAAVAPKYLPVSSTTRTNEQCSRGPCIAVANHACFIARAVALAKSRPIQVDLITRGVARPAKFVSESSRRYAPYPGVTAGDLLGAR
jgi:hypothetical protein